MKNNLEANIQNVLYSCLRVFLHSGIKAFFLYFSFCENRVVLFIIILPVNSIVKAFPSFKSRKFFPLHRLVLGILSKVKNGRRQDKKYKGNPCGLPPILFSYYISITMSFSAFKIESRISLPSIFSPFTVTDLTPCWLPSGLFTVT